MSSNGLYVSQRLSGPLIFKAMQSGEEFGNPYIKLLSDRELEVFRAMGHGLGTRAIADILGLSVKTIESHRAHIKRKLRVEDGADMVKLARDMQIANGQNHASDVNGLDGKTAVAAAPSKRGHKAAVGQQILSWDSEHPPGALIL